MATFEDLVRATRPALQRHAARLLRDQHGLAEDLVQETYLRLWRVWPGRSDTILTVARYRYTVLENCIHDFRRVKGNWPVTPTDVADHHHVEYVAEELALLQDSVAQDALKRLPQRLRQIVTLSVLDGVEMIEIASSLGLAVGTARNYKTAALKTLREMLREPQVP